jgi:flagellar motor switch protein FliN/FliY
MTPEQQQDANWLMEQWATSFALAVESMTEQRPDVRWEPKTESADAGEALWYGQVFSIVPEPSLWVGAGAKSWEELGARALRAAGLETAEPADLRSTYLEILTQAIAGFARAVAGRIGREVACGRGGDCAEPSLPASVYAATVRFTDRELPLVVKISPALVEALTAAEAPAAAPETAPAPAAPAASAGTAIAAEEPAAAASRTMDVLLDVQLPVSVSFGRTQLPIKDVLKLTTGSIVELRRTLDEPVEVVVNNCVIARGEVVVIEGNYGVRIQRIISRKDRLESLR